VNRRAVLRTGVVACTVLAGCSVSAGHEESVVTFLVRVPVPSSPTTDESWGSVSIALQWGIEASRAPDGTIPGPLIRVGDEFFGVMVTGLADPDHGGIDPCVDASGVETATVSFARFDGERFAAFQEVVLVDEWIDRTNDPILALDVTNDGVEEVLVGSNCLGSPTWSALRLAAGRWGRVPLPGVTTVRDGRLIGHVEDCRPSCAESGVTYTAYQWDGTSIQPAGLVTSSGEPVSLEVDVACSAYEAADSLPLRTCSSGPLVRRFLDAARELIGDYGDGASVTHSVDRVDEQVARWIVTYRYRHGLPITPVIDEEMWSALVS